MSNNFFDLLPVTRHVTVERPYQVFSDTLGDIREGREEVLEVTFGEGIPDKHSVLIWAVVERMYALDESIASFHISSQKIPADKEREARTCYNFIASRINLAYDRRLAALSVSDDDADFAAWRIDGDDSSLTHLLFQGNQDNAPFHWTEGRMTRYDLLVRLFDFLGNVPDVYYQMPDEVLIKCRGFVKKVTTTDTEVMLPAVLADDQSNILSIEMEGDAVVLFLEDREVVLSLGSTRAWKSLEVGSDEYMVFSKKNPVLSDRCSYTNDTRQLGDGTHSGTLTPNSDLEVFAIQSIYIEKELAGAAVRSLAAST